MSIEKFINAHRDDFDHREPPTGLWSAINRQLDGQPHSMEAFIAQHRADFDAAAPPDSVWEKIESSYSIHSNNLKQSKNPIHSFLRLAASVALLLIGIGIGARWATSKQLNDQMAMSQISKEYEELESFYQSEIQVKAQKLSVFAGQKEAIETDLKQIDATMQELQQELAKAPEGNREQIISAMIANYKTKIAILEKVLRHTNPEETSPNNNSKHERKNI